MLKTQPLKTQSLTAPPLTAPPLTAQSRDGGRYRLLVVGAAMMSAAAVIGLTGLTLGGAAVVSGVRRRIARMEVPPRQLARRQWNQARGAFSSGARAWRAGAVQRHDAAPASGVSPVPAHIGA